MSILCVEPVILAGKVSSFSSFSDGGDFLLHHFVKESDSSFDRYLNDPKFSYICFDALKALPVVDGKVPIMWDVKILYELLGYKFSGLVDLCKIVLGQPRSAAYEDLSSRVMAHVNSYKNVSVEIGAYEVLEVLPHDLVQDLYLERAKLVKDLFVKLSEKDKEFYISFYKSVKFLYRISSRPLHIDLNSIVEDTSHFSESIRKNTVGGKVYLKFKPVGAKTGRLGFKKGTLNLYTLPKNLRRCIVAPHGFKFVEFDFKSSQPRIAMFSTNNEEFMNLVRGIDDIYSIFPGDRSENKIGFLAWMYSKSRIPNSVFEQYAWPVWELRERLAKQSQEQGYLETRWGRKLYYNEEDKKHVIFQNFITATEVDCILNLAQSLEEEGLDVKLPFHDAIIGLIKDESLIPKYKEICEKFSEALFGTRFPVGAKIGHNLGQMHEI